MRSRITGLIIGVVGLVVFSINLGVVLGVAIASPEAIDHPVVQMVLMGLAILGAALFILFVVFGKR